MHPQPIDPKTSARNRNMEREQAGSIFFPRLIAIDRLVVGPVRLEPKRLAIPYTVIQNGTASTNELVYKYEESVFDPQEAIDQNLASMIGMQLALNYGLFCGEIVFDGPLDVADQRLLLDMMENTSREILVKKIHQPNVFLKEEVGPLPIRKQKRYTQATVAFINSSLQPLSITATSWTTDPQKHCVLSSGGKDSLLSYALLKEMGKDAHPIFGNESGRHWFTALNGYRYLKAEEPHTARVWMNADRLFAWMLRHLPFIREDFSAVRADDYPVRLWTVAVFLFGALPLMKKRGLGRLIIGDEYDSTQRGDFHGITHYNGLYDQSRFFDEALSRYFQKKGWGFSQFSLLRSMSEMLILKVLATRYPGIQRHQVSCHAAHERDGRIYPCGRCEKCRRIVGMLIALGLDPRHCGYAAEQVRESLESLRIHQVKQIGPDAAHLFYLLSQKEILLSEASPHPEIMQLRFDRGRSHITGIPADLRAPLFTILLGYANGAVHRVEKRWKSFDLLNDPEMETPYAFEK